MFIIHLNMILAFFCCWGQETKKDFERFFSVQNTLVFVSDTTSTEPLFYHQDCEKIAEVVEKAQCGSRNMYEKIYYSLRYPAIARENGIQGTVQVAVTISKEGYVLNARLVKDIGGGCGTEVLKIFEYMKEQGTRWIPAQKNGIAVESETIIPVKFRLE